MKIIWVPDETIVAARPMREWARHFLVELAGNGASLEELRAFSEKTGIPGRRKQYWGISTWHALLQPHVLLQYCGYAVWNVHTKHCMAGDRSPTPMKIHENEKVVERSVGRLIDVELVYETDWIRVQESPSGAQARVRRSRIGADRALHGRRDAT